MESLTLQPIARVDGTINLPGSKSVSNRALLLAALAHGKTVLTNLLDSDDVRHMLNALTALGVSYTLSADRTRCEIIGNGGPLHAEGALELFLGNAGTAMRPLAAALCLGSNDIVLTGEPRMKERPIGHLVDALRLGGAKITLQDSLGAAVAATYTAADGEFAFYDLADGTYTLMASADGYMAVSSVTAVIAGGSISNVVMTMTVDGRTYNGTVSGIIRDNAGRAVAGCFVGLYQVTDVAGVSQERLVSVTKTNAAGKYLFGGVGGGEYLVKAKLEQ